VLVRCEGVYVCGGVKYLFCVYLGSSMIREYVFFEYPIESDSETHVFVQQDGKIIQRCNSNNVSTDGEIMKVFEDEFEYVTSEYEDEFCPFCIRQIARL